MILNGVLLLIGVLDSAQLAVVGVVVKVIYLVDSLVPDGVDDDKHVGIGSDDVIQANAIPATRTVSKRVGQPRPG